MWAALLLAAAFAWSVTVSDARQMGNMPGTMGMALPAFALMWTIMMAAMMLPSVAPLASLYATAVRHRSSPVNAALRLTGLVLGYLLAWAAFGVVAYGAARIGGNLAMTLPDAAPRVAAAILAVCGVYQLTPWKDQCLHHCRSPMGFLLHVGNFRGRLRDVKAGLYHGSYCVGCCWGLMMVMILVGVMNLAWMVVLALVILIEKSWRYGKEFGYLFGVVLMLLAAFVPANPELLPGIFMR